MLIYFETFFLHFESAISELELIMLASYSVRVLWEVTLHNSGRKHSDKFCWDSLNNSHRIFM